jgi:ligand-binding sensor domain-containing protein/membrane-bound lytic murein transglycosylase MltF
MTRHPRILLSLILALICLFNYGRSLDEIRRSGKIYVAFTRDDLNNINYDLAREFARYLNVELIRVVIDWDEAFMHNGVIPEGLETDPSLSYTPDALKKADIICSTFTMIEWRKKLFSFAETLESAELLLIRKEDESPSGYTDLAGKRIAFTAVTTFEQHLNDINRSVEDRIKLVPTGSSAETEKLMEDGSVYGIVLDADEALAFNAGNGQKYKIAFPISDVSRMAWAVQKKNALAGEVENFFETITSNGVLDEFFYHRFGITYSAYLDRLSKKLKLEQYHRDLDEILASKKIVVALRDRNFIYREDGPKQFMYALAEEFAGHLGVDLEFVVTPYFGKYWEAKDGNVYRDSSYTPEWFNYFDLACEVIAPLDWRANKVDLVPVYPSAYVVVARKETSVKSMKDLRNLRGVTNRESVYEDFLRENGISGFYYEKVDNFIPDVASGKADYTIIYNAFYELSAYPDLEVKLELGNVNVCWALRKDQPQLEKELNEFISDSRNRGLIGTLLKAMRGKTLQSPEEFIHSYYETFQTGQMPYVNYGTDDGLPQEEILAIFQDRKGYIWFGTNSGAVRYNGRDMSVYNRENGLPDPSVRDIAQDSSGNLYFATGNGIARLKGDNTAEVLLEGISFQRLFIDSDDQCWFLGDKGIYLRSADGSIRHLNDEFPVLPDKIYQVTEDPATGNIMMATVLGVFMYDPSADRVTQLSSSDSYSLFIDANDSIWIATSKGLFITHVNDLINNRFDAVTRNLTKRLELPVQHISEITTSKFGSVWLVTDSRILQVISSDQEPIVYEQETGIRNDKILSFMVDREDNLWIGFSGGLQRLTNRQGIRNFFPGTFDSHVYSVFEDFRDRIWITSDNGVFYFSNDQLVRFSPQTGSPGEILTGTLLPGGNILLAGEGAIYEVDAATLRIAEMTRFQASAGRPENVFVSSRGEIFLLTGISGAVYYFGSFSAEPVVIRNKFTENLYQLIEYEGQIIGGTGEGFVLFKGSNFQLLEETRCPIRSLRMEDEKIWVGTNCGIGLVSDGRFDRMEIKPVRGNPVIKSILPARNRNYLWLGTNKGFIHYNTTTGESELTISSADGLSGDEISPGGLYLDRNSLLWVGTYHGISNFNIRARSGISYAPVCYIEKLLVNGEKTVPQEGQVFPHDRNNIQFEISALCFTGEGSMEYEYYLRGLGNNFSSYHGGTDYRAYYNNLPPGRYEFIYRAKGNNNWGYAEKFGFSIRKAWFNTWLFRLGLLLLITLTVSFITGQGSQISRQRIPLWNRRSGSGITIFRSHKRRSKNCRR